ncbi:hypothetical protein NL676_013420 [Syzygium grande]|nr:hypothetical protein NL676_013420 [Syzygium grande]
MSSIPSPPLPTTHHVSASPSVVPPRHHPSHVSPPPPVPGNTFPITTSSALPPPPPHPSLPTPPRSSWIESLCSQARLNLSRDTVSTYADILPISLPTSSLSLLSSRPLRASGTSILGGRFTPMLSNLEYLKGTKFLGTLCSRHYVGMRSGFLL